MRRAAPQKCAVPGSDADSLTSDTCAGQKDVEVCMSYDRIVAEQTGRAKMVTSAADVLSPQTAVSEAKRCLRELT